ncbi:enoyl-CoA hydratase/isomerase family protein [Paraburkholderia sp. MM5384-R2]|uniref:enoyl-CoA hydratase/isomerase family protein n=1 Tax=Paraburkholderia sp. MM5384-R2 TaxID=2723097 RepID=UPI00161CEB9A|nr:enoyl-CoA hydratase/isomerase family protein [Paraburkholderia sp. MM5384-R2]MBB5503130.1 enoyl-CoA hydratase/carnithine racemase [Paraburkholderia sp. MM5384-R2]
MIDILKPDEIGSASKYPASVAQITLGGHSRENYLDASARRQTLFDISTVQADPAISAVVLSGPPEGAFCSGGDRNEVRSVQSANDVDGWLDSIVELYLAVLQCKKPVIAAISGHACGQGLQLALLCDIRIASYGAKFSEPGLVDGVGCAIGATILREVTSGSVTRELVYGCREIGALTALEHNLINHVVKQGELLDSALHWADRLSSYDHIVFEYTKRIASRRMKDELQRCLPIAREMHKQLRLREGSGREVVPH